MPNNRYNYYYISNMYTYYFDKIIYWKIPKSHNVTIKRDKKWFSSVYPILQETWKKVCYYREHLDELPKIQEIANKRKKFYRMNTNIKMNNFQDGVDFLSKEVTKKNAKKQKVSIHKSLIVSQDCDFVD